MCTERQSGGDEEDVVLVCWCFGVLVFWCFQDGSLGVEGRGGRRSALAIRINRFTVIRDDGHAASRFAHGIYLTITVKYSKIVLPFMVIANYG